MTALRSASSQSASTHAGDQSLPGAILLLYSAANAAKCGARSTARCDEDINSPMTRLFSHSSMHSKVYKEYLQAIVCNHVNNKMTGVADTTTTTATGVRYKKEAALVQQLWRGELRFTNTTGILHAQAKQPAVLSPLLL